MPVYHLSSWGRDPNLHGPKDSVIRVPPTRQGSRSNTRLLTGYSSASLTFPLTCRWTWLSRVHVGGSILRKGRNVCAHKDPQEAGITEARAYPICILPAMGGLSARSKEGMEEGTSRCFPMDTFIPVKHAKHASFNYHLFLTRTGEVLAWFYT